MISTIFHEKEWLPWKFETVPNGFWNDKNNQRNFLEWLGNELGFKNQDDWYKVTTTVSSRNL